jgi:hypothetical protein
MTTSPQKYFLTLVALASLACPSMARSEEVPKATSRTVVASSRQELLKIAPGFAITKKVAAADNKTDLTAIAADTDIAEIVIGPLNTFVLKGKKQGITNVIVLDDTGTEIYNSIIEVGFGGTVKIHNKALLTSYTAYRCTRGGCVYVDELTAKEPAPLPAGYTNGTVDSNPSNAPAK